MATVLRRLAPSRGLSCSVARSAMASTPAPAPPRVVQPPVQRSLFNLAAAALNAASGSQQTITTVRTLPFAAADLFRIIADVDAYADFLPHCTTSRVTHWRTSAATGDTKWPARADLTVGWGPVSQTYSSRVYCVPGHGVVEAVSGRAGSPTLTALERAEIGLVHSEDADGRRLAAQTATEDDTFESLVTRWKVSEASASTTRVELHIRFQFRNPMLQMAAAQVGNEMAGKMHSAFENRAAALLEKTAKP